MKKGFTLAETLITLSIIGVVAVLVLPTINNNIWKTQREALVKNMTAKIQNAMQQSISDLGYVPHCGYWGTYNPNSDCGYSTRATEWNDDGTVKKWETFDKDGNTVKAVGGNSNGMIESNDCLALGKLMEKHLSITKKCKDETNCKAYYKGADTSTYEQYEEEGSLPEEDYEKIKEITGSDDYETNLAYYANMKNGGSGRKQYYIDRSYALYLKDNSYILNLAYDSKTFFPRWYAIDINGIKGPNKWGHDLFYIYTRYEKDGNSLGMDTSTTVSECYNGYKGQSIDDILQNKNPAKCTK